jgi:hypothetical protein
MKIARSTKVAVKNLVLFAISLIFSLSLHAKNIELQDNQKNCEKIDGYGQGDIMAIARKFKVSMRSVRFIGAEWSYGPYGSKECLLIFDTDFGPKKCTVLYILSSDGGKTAFASVDPYKSGEATSCY